MIKSAVKFVTFTIFADEKQTKVCNMRNTLLIKNKKRKILINLLT